MTSLSRHLGIDDGAWQEKHGIDVGLISTFVYNALQHPGIEHIALSMRFQTLSAARLTYQEKEMPNDMSTASHVQRSLRQCLAVVAELLYDNGHVLETITLTKRGLSSKELQLLNQSAPDWATCQQVLETSQAATRNEQGRFVLTPMGRELMFDMFGEGAADCA
ncbi:hypothetical protein [Halomonas sp. A40-4]|uniref:hypothetical protein n=1 Tax=Halomonas sp. A40-4 TaxID=2785909 RepID=UPI002D810C1B|nr:hypothetical protein [Halomonas sp. A40-4]